MSNSNAFPEALEGANHTYCNSLTSYSRFKTRVVDVGGVPMGGSNPIRIQSMTTTDTMDTEGTVAQSIRIIEAGADYVRITTPSLKEAQNLEAIKNSLRNKGYSAPLIADIHFTPNAAELAARIVEKVRVNPGNYADKKKFAVKEYSEKEYQLELERIRNKFVPLVQICKEYGTAMRIGTNHGSLSDRIMNRHGDTPNGMVESALEFVRICEDEGYHDLTLSMKASNPQVMVQAYRLLTQRMIETDRDYPLHLGVTEAGEGEDGRIKSAVGIGALLEDGLGDTVRVSLTEEPEYEVPVARLLVDRYSSRQGHAEIKSPSGVVLPYNPFDYLKRKVNTVHNIGGDNVPRVIVDCSAKGSLAPKDLKSFGYNYDSSLDKWNISDIACDFLFTNTFLPDFDLPGTLGVICNLDQWKNNKDIPGFYPFMTAKDYIESKERHPHLNFVYVTFPDITRKLLDLLKMDNSAVVFSDTYNDHGMAEQRRLVIELMENDVKAPVIIGRAYGDLTEAQLQLYSATDVGGLLLDGLGDGVFVADETHQRDELVNRTVFNVLQATRTRISKTEYISCPSCGRTLFDLQETTAKIRARTNHLKGVKIGIMGCIVNGPGEMADADYGYVGTGPGKITLYKGREVVQRNIPSKDAVDALIQLIKDHGDWVEQ